MKTSRRATKNSIFQERSIKNLLLHENLYSNAADAQNEKYYLFSFKKNGSNDPRK